MYNRPSAPQNITGTLDDGFRLYIASLKTVLPLSFIGSVISVLPQAAITALGGEEALLSTDASLLIAIGGASLFIIAGMLALYGGLVAQMDAFANGKALFLSEAIMFGIGRMLPLFGASIIYGICVVIGFILLIIPGVILSLYWILFMVTAVLDDKGPIQSLTYSYQLIRGAWWRIALFMTVLTLIYMVVYSIFIVFLIGGTIGTITAGGEPDMSAIDGITLVVTPILGAFMTPFLYAFLLAIRHDLKLRKEGSDLASRIEGSMGA
jgi:hypothetical protein